MARSTLDLVVGIVLIVFGVLLVLNRIGIAWILPWAAIALIVLGILVLVKVMPGSTLIGLVAITVGLLLALGILEYPQPYELPRAVRDAAWILNIVLGAVLMALGIQKLRRLGPATTP